MDVLAKKLYRSVHRIIQFKFILERRLFGELILVIRIMFMQTTEQSLIHGLISFTD